MRIQPRWLLLPLFLFVSYLSIRSLNIDPLWVDEWWTIHIAGGSTEGPLTIPQIWERTSVEDAYWPPGYEFTYALWGNIVGWSPLAGRAFSFFVGIIAIAWVYRLGADLFSARTGLIAAILIGTGTYFIYFFHEMRGYSFYIMFVAMTVSTYWRSINGQASRLNYVFLFLGSLGLLYTNYLAALTLIVLGVYHLLFVAKNRQWWVVAVVMTLPGLLFLPWLAVVLTALTSASQDFVRREFAFTPLQSVKGVLYMFSNGCIALLGLFGFYSLRRQASVWFAWFWGIGVFILLILANARFGVVLEVRYLMPVFPALAIIAGYGVNRLLNSYRLPTLLMLGVWVLAGVWNTFDPLSVQQIHNPHFHLPWDELTEQVEAHMTPQDALAFVLPDWTWRAYHTPVFNYYLHDIPLRRQTLMERPYNVGEDVYQQTVESLVTDDPLLWVGYTPAQPTIQLKDFQDLVAAQNYLHCATVYESPLMRFDLYSPSDSRDQAEAITFGDDGINQRSITASVHAEQKTLDVTQIWSVAANVPQQTYSVGLHIDNAQGQLVAQTDYGLPQESLACHWSSIDVSGLPTGEYELLVVVYAWESGERLMATSAQNAEPVDRAVVATFTIP